MEATTQVIDFSGEGPVNDFSRPFFMIRAIVRGIDVSSPSSICWSLRGSSLVAVFFRMWELRSNRYQFLSWSLTHRLFPSFARHVFSSSPELRKIRPSSVRVVAALPSLTSEKDLF